MAHRHARRRRRRRPCGHPDRVRHRQLRQLGHLRPPRALRVGSWRGWQGHRAEPGPDHRSHPAESGARQPQQGRRGS